MTAPEEIYDRRAAYEDDADSVRGGLPGAIRTIVTAVRDLAAVERERDELRAEVERLRAGEDAEPRDPAIVPTVAQAWHALLEADPEQRAKWLDGLLRASEDAARCFRMNHEAENAMLRECRDTEQRALAAALPIVAAATQGPTLYLEPDPFGEPVIWADDAQGVPHAVLGKSDLCVGSRHLWPVVVARLTAGSAS